MHAARRRPLPAAFGSHILRAGDPFQSLNQSALAERTAVLLLSTTEQLDLAGSWSIVSTRWSMVG